MSRPQAIEAICNNSAHTGFRPIINGSLLTNLLHTRFMISFPQVRW